jgi:hypothetical protein
MANAEQLLRALQGADDSKLKQMAQIMSQYGAPDTILNQNPLGGKPPMMSPTPPPGTGAMMNPLITEPAAQVMPTGQGDLASAIDPSLAMAAFQQIQAQNQAAGGQRPPMPQVSIPSGMGQRPMMQTDARFQNQVQTPQQLALARLIQGGGY